MKTTITVYKAKDDSGAMYQNPAIKSRHNSIAAAVKSATLGGLRSGKFVIIRDSDGRQFSVTKMYGSGCVGGRGEWEGNEIDNTEKVEF